MRLRELASRLIGSVGLGRRENEVAEELAFHRAQLEAEHRRRGLSEAAARRAAQLELGGNAQIIDAWRDQQGLPWLDMLRQDVQYGLRTLVRAPGFTVAALLTLTLGIGANTAIFSVVNAVLLRPLPFPNASRVITLGDRQSDGTPGNVGFATAVDWRARSRSFSQIALMRSWTPTLIVNGEAERLEAVRVTANYFATMGVAPVLGRPFSDAEDTPEGRRVVILSDGLWRRRFNADPSIVGRTLQISGAGFRVVGVMPAGFDPLDAQRYSGGAEIWAPVSYRVGDDSACRSCQHLRAFGLLAPGVSLDGAAAEMNTIRADLKRQYPADYPDGSIAVITLRDALMGDVRRPLYVLLGAVAFVLLIACANVANLLLARSQTRGRELAVRAALGAGRGRIVRQLVTESTLLALAGGGGALLLAGGLVRGLGGIAPVSLPRVADARVDLVVIAFTFGVSLLTGAVVGVLPAFRAASLALCRTLADDSRGSVGAGGRLQSVLVVADLTLALVLLTGAGLMLRTTMSLTRVDPGFDPERLLTWQLSLAGQRYADNAPVVDFQDRLVTRLRALPGVTAVALADQIPFGGNYDCRGFHTKGRMQKNSADDPCIERYGTTPDYLSIMHIPLRAGRFFTAGDTATSQPVIAISEATRRLVWGDADPLGSQVRFGSAEQGPWCTVVGVVGDVHHADLAAAAKPAFYVPEAQYPDSDLVAIVQTARGDPSSLAASATAAVREIDPSVPTYDVAALTSRVADASAAPRYVMQLLGGFAVTALLLAAIGLYGVVSYGVSQRTREVGVRVALGATPNDVLRLILTSAASLVAVGLATGVVVALLTTRLLGSLMFDVSPLDPIAFTTSATVLVIVAGLAHLVPAVRAVGINPTVALRQD